MSKPKLEDATLINVRVSRKDRDAFVDFCESAGLTMSAAINVYIKKVIKEQRIPFEIGIRE